MKIGIVCPYDLTAPGGVQQLVLELATELRLAGHETVVVGAGKPDASAGGDSSVELVGATVRIEANDSVVPLSLSPGVRGRVRRAVAGVDVVHVHEPLVPLVGWAGLTTGLPTVATFHADPPQWVPGLYRRLPVGRVMGRTVVTAVSPTAAAALPDDWGPVEVIPNAIDVGSYALTADRNPHRVAFLGRDDPRKGLDVLLDAWPLVRAEVPDAELTVMGADRNDRIPGVEFLGRVGDAEKRKVLASASVFAAPNTRGESFGIVVLEAMAAGCAVVASDIPAFRDVAGDTARLVSPGDSGELARAIISLLADPSAATALGEAARERARLFDWPEISAKYVRAYELALGLSTLSGW